MPSYRGKITNVGFASQYKDVSGLIYGKGTPTDVDVLLELRGNLGKIIGFMELKYLHSELPAGQRMAFESVVDLCNPSCLASFGLVLSHETPVEEAIMVHLCPVEEIRWKNKWHKVDGKFLTIDICDRLVARFVPERLDRPLSDNIALDLFIDCLLSK
jgi:hypothetical protein